MTSSILISGNNAITGPLHRHRIRTSLQGLASLMEIMMPASHAADQGGLNTTSYDYDQDTAHTVEVQREMDDNGQLGSFGFTLLYERPPIVGTIVPGECNIIRVC